jgi:hypothetical protein
MSCPSSSFLKFPSFIEVLLAAIKGFERGVVLLTVSLWEGVK